MAAVMSTFEWDGETLGYADHAYNTTRLNERAVELPIVEWWLRGTDGLRTLEVGNVLGHYGIGPARTVVDRYEQAGDVLNVDVFDVTGEWDRIVSVSTLEHVRWDEPGGRVAGGGAEAVEHLLGLLSPGGRMLVTVPTGWNGPLDEWLLRPSVAPSNARTLERVGDGWVMTSEPVIRPYGVSQPWAEAVWIVEWVA